MDITDFFINFPSIFVENKPVIYFTGENCQHIFLDKTKDFIEKQAEISIKKINADGSFSDIISQLSTTFLGQKNFYWISNLESMAAGKKKTDIIQFLKNYSGPHRLFVFVCSSDLDSSFNSDSIYTCKNNYTNDSAKKITVLYENMKLEMAEYFYNKIFTIKKEYSLSQLCLLKEYAMLFGNNIGQFIDEWIEKLVISDISLFYLSQLFFEKNATDFFIKWDKIRILYSDQFWTAFFSEQLFKSYFYVHHNGIIAIDQKQLTFGLPFSFLKQDWKMYKCDELQKAHQRIYEIDLSLKSGGSKYQLDVFLMAFFNENFC